MNGRFKLIASSVINPFWLFPLYLCCMGVGLRLLFVSHNTFPFMYDHARDALAVMHLVETQSPTLIGPRASIDGLFFGPGWYYLITPFFVIGQWHPLSPVVFVILLYIFEVFLLYRFFGKWPAFLATFTPGWWWIASSAWNPFPLALTSLILIVLLKTGVTEKRFSSVQWGLLGVTVGAAFHFSTAYALFYPIILFFSVILLKIPLRVKNTVVVLSAFLLPWVPQLLFELRHDFIEFRSVMAYVQQGGASEYSIGKIVITEQTILSTLSTTVLPAFSDYLSPQISAILLGLIVLGIFLKSYTTKAQYYLWLFILIPMLGYMVLHFSKWYVIGMYPSIVILVGLAIRQLPRNLQYFMAGAYVGLACCYLGYFVKVDQPRLSAKKDFLPMKLIAVNTIRELAGTEEFSSYHFVPEVYDYTYQYLYLWQAKQGLPLPIEFSYQPAPIAYYPERDELYTKFAQKRFQDDESDLIFFIVEQPEYQNVLDEWWTRQLPHEIVKEVQISPELKVYQAKRK